MVEIKLNSMLSRYRVKGFVDPEQVNFIDGVALVEATMIDPASFLGEKDTTYKCYGLINERYEEAFQDMRTNFDNRYLMFKGHNREATRINDRDFLIKVNCADEDRSWNEWQHIRIVDGVPTKMQEFRDVEKTNVDHLITDGHAVYDILKGYFVTRKFSSVEALPLDEDGKQRFRVRDNILPLSKSGETIPKDRLHFVVDEEGNITSQIVSEYTGDFLPVIPSKEMDYSKLVRDRKEELKTTVYNGEILIKKIMTPRTTPQIESSSQE